MTRVPKMTAEPQGPLHDTPWRVAWFVNGTVPVRREETGDGGSRYWVYMPADRTWLRAEGMNVNGGAKTLAEILLHRRAEAGRPTA